MLFGVERGIADVAVGEAAAGAGRAVGLQPALQHVAGGVVERVTARQLEHVGRGGVAGVERVFILVRRKDGMSGPVGPH